MARRSILLNSVRQRANQTGINMVDLMMWLVIAALLLAAALQGIGYYQKAAIVYQVSNDLETMGTNVMAETAQASSNGKITDTVLTTAMSVTNKTSPEVKFTVSPDPWDDSRSILAATHPTIVDHYIVYLFAPSGGYSAGVHVIAKNSFADNKDPFAGPGPQPTAHPTTFTSYFGINRMSLPMSSSNAHPRAFTLPGALTDYTVTWSETGMDSMNAKIGATQYGSKGANPTPWWGAQIMPKSGSYTSGVATLTANIVENATGKKSSKTWTFDSTGDYTIAASPDYASFFNDQNVFVGSKESRTFFYTVTDTYYNSASNYTKTYSAIDNQTSTTGVNIVKYAEPTGFRGNFGISTTDPRGFQKGTISVTITMTSNVSGIVHDHKFSINIVDTSAVPFEVVSTPMTNNLPDMKAGSTQYARPVEFSLNPFPYGDISSYKVEVTPLSDTVSDINAVITTATSTGRWYLIATPQAGGFNAAGSSTTVQVKVTHTATGVSNINTFKMTVKP